MLLQQHIRFVLITTLFFLCSAFLLTNSAYADTKSAAPSEVIFFPKARDISPFTLTTNKNTPFTLDSFKGHWTLLFFGFTHCPHICPTSMEKMQHVYKELSPDYPSLQVALVTIDPARDTAAVLNQYVDKYNSKFIGVTGDEKVRKSLEKQVGAFSSSTLMEDGTYDFEHSSSILLINPQGQWVGVFPFATTPKDFVTAFKQNVKSS